MYSPDPSKNAFFRWAIINAGTTAWVGVCVSWIIKEPSRIDQSTHLESIGEATGLAPSSITQSTTQSSCKAINVQHHAYSTSTNRKNCIRSIMIFAKDHVILISQSYDNFHAHLDPANTTLSALPNSGCLRRSSITAVRILDPWK